MKAIEVKTSEYGDYYTNYIQLAKEHSLLEGLELSARKFVDFFESIPNEKHEYRYAEGKWTAKEMIQHLLDTERIFAYRALSFAREDKTNLPGFEHNDYIEPSKANRRTVEDLLEEYKQLRATTIALFKSFDEIMLLQQGNANNNPLSVRAIGFIIIGHETHHCNIFRERYL